MRSRAPNSAAWATTRCTAWCTSSARRISISGWRHGRRRNSNGDGGYGSFARSSGLYPKIYFQPGSQSHWHSVFLPGAHGGVGGDVYVAADAHPFAVAERRSAAGRRDQAGDVSQSADHARDDHGVLRADHGAAGRVRKLFSSDSDWCAGYGVPGPEYAFVLDDVCRVRLHHRGIFCDRRSAAAWVDGIRAAECVAIGRPGGTIGRGLVDYKYCDFLHRIADGGAELYYDYA